MERNGVSDFLGWEVNREQLLSELEYSDVGSVFIAPYFTSFIFYPVSLDNESEESDIESSDTVPSSLAS